MPEAQHRKGSSSCPTITQTCADPMRRESIFLDGTSFTSITCALSHTRASETRSSIPPLKLVVDPGFLDSCARLISVGSTTTLTVSQAEGGPPPPEKGHLLSRLI